MARSKIDNDAKGKTSNEKCTIKKNILNYNDEIISASSTNEKCTIKKNILSYNDEIISASSTTIAIKKRKVAPTKIIFQRRRKRKKINNLHEVCK